MPVVAVNSTSLAFGNAMATELGCYGILPEPALVQRISLQAPNVARKMCNDILKEYTVGKLNKPLFTNWESRTEFKFEEMVVQILGYMFQLSGNDLEDPSYMQNLLSKVDYDKLQLLSLATDEQATNKLNTLLEGKMSLDKASVNTLTDGALYFFDIINNTTRIKSDEARMAMLYAMVSSGRASLRNALSMFKCKPSDAMRYAAVKKDFTQVKLPATTMYASLKWNERIALLEFLNGNTFDYLSEAMGQNRECWTRFFKHIHLFDQKDFVKRFPLVNLAARVSCGHKTEDFPKEFTNAWYELVHGGIIEILPSGNTVYRTFASRIATAIENQDFDKIVSLCSKNSGYLLRNLATVSNGVSKKHESKFVDFVRESLDKANPDVLFSILGINVDAKYRVIDVKGDTIVTDANYPRVIKDIQGDITRLIQSKYGFNGKVVVDKDIKNMGVPFLSKNSDLVRGTRIKFDDKEFLYFFMHWVQKTDRTDLDHSYISFDSNWNSETVYFGYQANSYLTHGGDITNAPAPNGATEYGKIRLKDIPKSVKYIAPVVNVYTGAAFSENAIAYAGFMFSDSSNFDIKRDHVRYDLSQPAKSNIPFIVDVVNREIVIIDYNNRTPHGITAHSEIGNLKKIISATNDKNFITVGMLAKMLSGDGDSVDLTIKKTVSGENKTEIDPQSLFSLFA